MYHIMGNISAANYLSISNLEETSWSSHGLHLTGRYCYVELSAKMGHAFAFHLVRSETFFFFFFSKRVLASFLLFIPFFWSMIALSHNLTTPFLLILLLLCDHRPLGYPDSGQGSRSLIIQQRLQGKCWRNEGSTWGAIKKKGI